MTAFSEKIRRVPDTITLAADADVERLTDALRQGRGRVVFAIGSGGSAVAAEYLVRCRSTLDLGYTIVQTPMEFVLANGCFDGCEIWLFSAGADNPDIAGALRAALVSHAAAIRLITVRKDGATALKAAAESRCDVYVLPVADPKDGFLATHSMAATVAALLFASAGFDGSQAEHIHRAFAAESAQALSMTSDSLPSVLFGLSQNDTLIVLHDPQLRSLGVLIETSLWETGMCPVQRADFRNFAHGRHVWIARRRASTCVLSLTTAESRDTWGSIDRLLPADLRRGALDFGHAGRIRTAVGIMTGLAIVEAIGRATGVDPGRPGVGEFAKPIYEDPSLDQLSRHLTPAVRHKRDAILLHGPALKWDDALWLTGHQKRRGLQDALFKAVVLDYDGTIVSTADRLLAPNERVLGELVRLIDGGIAVGIATGRGGSVGEMLREQLPPRVHVLVVVGYYNGGHIRTLDVDIATDRPAQNADLLAVADWIVDRNLLTANRKLKRGFQQIMLNHADLIDPITFRAELERCHHVADGRVRVLSSHHSFDIVPQGTSKIAVVRAVLEQIGAPEAAVLCIGDSGSPGGNDHELLSGLHGVSVDTVCGNVAGCWSLFGHDLTGPAALLRILTSLKIEGGNGCLDLSALFPDQ